MNIAGSFVSYMISVGFGTTLGTDVFIGGVPQDAPSTAWWVVSQGGTLVLTNQTGEKIKSYTLQVFYRNIDGQDVYDELQDLEIELNKSNCAQLTGFDTMEIESNLFPTDNDIDLEERTIGMLQVKITTYYKE